MAKLSKKQKGYAADIDRSRDYSVAEAAEIIKTGATAKFDETIEIAINLGVDPRHADQMVRGAVAMPNGTGKDVRVAVFARDAKADEAKAAGAEFVGAEELAEAIQNGESGFDRVIASPDMMGVVGRLGKVLGPRGLMPNPKVGTVTPNVAEAVRNAKAGQVRFRTDKNGIIHAGVGKIDFEAAALKQNVEALLVDLRKLKPSSSKGVYMKKVTLSSTMGPGLTIDMSSLSA